MTIDYREDIGGEFREVNPDLRQVEARVCSYNVGPDTYRTTWQKGVFEKGIREHGLPVVCWGHDQRDVIGSVIGYRDADDGFYVTMQFANPDDVPSARRAYSLIKDGHVRGWSFGFSNGVTEADPQHRGARRFRSARIFEVSPVVRASVPLTRTVSVRSEDGEEYRAGDDSALAAALHAVLVGDGVRSATTITVDGGTVTATAAAVEEPTGAQAVGVSDELLDSLAAIDTTVQEAARHALAIEDTWPPAAKRLAESVLTIRSLTEGARAEVGVTYWDDDVEVRQPDPAETVEVAVPEEDPEVRAAAAGIDDMFARL